MKKFLLFWFPIIAWAGIIFIFSSQPYDKHNVRPLLKETINLDWVTSMFSKFHVNYAGKVISVQTVGADGFLEFFIRKGAHFMVFFILGWLIYRALFFAYKSRQQLHFMLSLTLVVFYAASDEFHQMFTDNRTPLIHDVFLDIIGGIIGILIATIYYKRIVVSHSKLSIRI